MPSLMSVGQHKDVPSVGNLLFTNVFKFSEMAEP